VGQEWYCICLTKTKCGPELPHALPVEGAMLTIHQFCLTKGAGAAGR